MSRGNALYKSYRIAPCVRLVTWTCYILEGEWQDPRTPELLLCSCSLSGEYALLLTPWWSLLTTSASIYAKHALREMSSANLIKRSGILASNVLDLDDEICPDMLPTIRAGGEGGSFRADDSPRLSSSQMVTISNMTPGEVSSSMWTWGPGEPLILEDSRPLEDQSLLCPDQTVSISWPHHTTNGNNHCQGCWC